MNALSVEVSSSAGDPVMGGVVTFMVPSGGASASLSELSATISCRGDAASVTAIANGSAGSYGVTATAAGAAAPAVFALTNTLPKAAPLDTTTTLTSSLSPSTAGQSVTFTATVSATDTSDSPAGTVTFTIDGHESSPVPVTAANGKVEASFVTSALAAGSHVITASYSGDLKFGPSDSSATTQVVNPVAITPPVVPPVIVDGPAIVSVERFGFHMRPTKVVLTFNKALDASTARDSREYRIIGPAGRVIGIKSVSYDPTKMTVTLHPKQRINIHHTYKLIVGGTAQRGLTDAQGRLLDGADHGQPGTDYRATFDLRSSRAGPDRAPKLAIAQGDDREREIEFTAR